MPILTAQTKTRAATIASSATEVTGIPLAHARRWHLLITNVHASQAITACRIRRRPVAGGAVGPWESITAGLPLAAGGTLSVRETDDCSHELDLELTASGAGTGVEIDLAGV